MFWVRKGPFGHCGFLEQSRGFSKGSRLPNKKVSRTSPEVTRHPQRSTLLSRKYDALWWLIQSSSENSHYNARERERERVVSDGHDQFWVHLEGPHFSFLGYPPMTHQMPLLHSGTQRAHKEFFIWCAIKCRFGVASDATKLFEKL